MEAEVTIRQAKLDDIAAVCNIERLSFSEPYPPQLLMAYLSISPGFFMVAEVNGKVVGYALGILRGRGVGHVASIAVDPERRGEGIGTKLMLELMRRFREAGASSFRLEVRVSNVAAQKLYEKLGFRKAYRIRRYYSDGEDCYVLIRRESPSPSSPS